METVEAMETKIQTGVVMVVTNAPSLQPSMKHVTTDLSGMTGSRNVTITVVLIPIPIVVDPTVRAIPAKDAVLEKMNSRQMPNVQQHVSHPLLVTVALQEQVILLFALRYKTPTTA